MDQSKCQFDTLPADAASICKAYKPAGQPEQADFGAMFVQKLLCNVNNIRALIGLCLLMMSHLGQIRDTIASPSL